MEKIFDKISSYHILNYIIPGFLYLYFTAEQYIDKTDDYLLLFMKSYIIGLIISRISSLVVEKLVLVISNLKKIEYNKYINATINDNKIEILMQDANMFRNICTAFCCIMVYRIINVLIPDIFVNVIFQVIIIVILIILFAISYIKQCKYVIKRANSVDEKNNKD